MESQPKNLEFRINPENFHPAASFVLLFGSILMRMVTVTN